MIKKRRYIEITVIVFFCIAGAWCMAALLINPSMSETIEDADVHPTKGYVAFKYHESGAIDG